MLNLTAAQAEMLNLLRLGYSCQAASAKLGISDNTGQDRIKRARKNLECETIYQAVAEFAVAKALEKLEKST